MPLLKQTHSLLKRESPCGQPTNGKAALRRLSSGQTQSVPPPLPPRLSLGQLPSLPGAGQPRMPSSQQRLGGESHPRLARLSSSHQPSLPRILSQSSVHHGETSIIYGIVSHNSLLEILCLGSDNVRTYICWCGKMARRLILWSAHYYQTWRFHQEGFKFPKSLEQIYSIKSWKKSLKHFKYVQVSKSVTIQGDGFPPQIILKIIWNNW